jgi:hypothetical protein
MIFQHSLEQVLSGKKTQTRRRINPGRRFLYRAGKSYSVKPRRTQAGVARIEVVNIRQEPLGEMTHEDALAEGFASVDEYRQLWIKQYGAFDPEERVWVIEFRLLNELIVKDD